MPTGSIGISENTTLLFMRSVFQFVSRVDIKYKRMNSNERMRILNPGSVTIPRPEGERRVEMREVTAGERVCQIRRVCSLDSGLLEMLG